MQIPQSRITSRDGVNAARAFFEHHGCVFQEVGLENDFGKDAYVDIGEAGRVTHLCAALQIKSGASYRDAGDYAIPVDSHAEIWRHSTVPVFGLVYDPSDQLLRWIDLTGYLRAHPDQDGGSVPILRRQTLDHMSLHGAFKNAVAVYASAGATGLTLNLLAPGPLQTGAVYDAWALSRSDPHYLLVLRRFIADLLPDALRRAIWLLSHAGSHPNILWTKDNWIKPEAEKLLLPSFRWSPEEMEHMLRAVGVDDYGSGTLGECLDVLLYEDSNVVAKMHITINLLLKGEHQKQAVRAATLALTHARDQQKEVNHLTQRYPALLESDWFREVAAAVHQGSRLSLY
jgi:hypothetical protein